MPVKIQAPKDVVKLLEAYANAHGVTVMEAGNRLVAAVGTAHLFHGHLRFLGEDWQAASLVLRRSAQESVPKEGSVRNGGETQVEGEPVLSAEQLALLERSSALSSGFAHVYSNGAKGWRALIRTPTERRWLPTRRTADVAAWDHYQWRQSVAASGAPIAPPVSDPVEENYRWLKSQYPEREEAALRREAAEMEDLRRG